MAIVNIVSVKIKDFIGGSGGTKTIPFKLPATTTLATINTVLGSMLPALDATIDGQIVAATVELQLTLPSGLKSAPVVGKDVHNGSLLVYDPAATNYSYAIYVPTWKEAGFSGQNVLNTGAYATFITELITDNFTDGDGNTFVTYENGSRVRRK